MSEIIECSLYALLIGSGATASMDIWTLARQRIFGIAALDYGLLGRWIAHLFRGRLRHERIAAATPARGERLIGWAAHYSIGIFFAGLVLAIWGLDWALDPSIAPALIVGIGTVVAPFFILLPAMGAGIAASRAPRPNIARLHSIVTHAVFGLGLYASAWLLSTVQ